MVEITIFELNLDSADITANAPGSGRSDAEPLESDAELDNESGGGLPTGLVLAVVAALVASVVAVVAAKKLRGGDEPASTDAL